MKKALFVQLSEDFKKKIVNGEWDAGKRIPSEIELAKSYSVGRSTIREALNILQNQKMIQKRNGVGTFVRKTYPVLDNPLLHLDSVGKMIKKAGCTPQSIVYKQEHREPDEEMIEKLNLQSSESIVLINRGRIADQIPVAFSYNIFPEKYVGNIFDRGLKGSIFKVLEEKCDIIMDYAESEIYGLSVQIEWDLRASEFLHSPIVLMKQLHYDTQGRPVLYSYDYLNTDVVKLGLTREI